MNDSKPLIGVVDESATFRRGMRGALEDAGMAVAEFGTDAVGDFSAVDAAILTVESGAGTVALSDIRAGAPALPLVALVHGADVSDSVNALRTGCAAVLPWNSDPEVIVAAVRAALNGMATISLATAGEVVSRMRPEPSSILDKREAEWLRFLADGKTVASLADQVGYSEREMFRILGDLYHRLGAANRSEALVKAARLGMFDD